MQRTSFLAFLAWLCCAYAGSAPVPAPTRFEPELPKGVTQVALPEGFVVIEAVREGDTWLVKVRAKGVTLTASRVFLRDRDYVIEFTAGKGEVNGKEEGEIKLTTPKGTSSFFVGETGFARGTFIVAPADEGGRDRLRAGDVVLTHPKLRIEAGNVDHLVIQVESEKPK